MDTKHYPTEADPTTDALAERLMDAVPRLWRLMAAEAQSDAVSALTMTQFRILKLLRLTPHLPSEIAREMGLRPATISEVVDGLVRRGLVERGDEPQDRRATPLTITPAGLDLLEAIRARSVISLSRVLNRITPPERASLAQGLVALSRALAETRSGGK